jgi:membrane protease subunit HflK
LRRSSWLLAVPVVYTVQPDERGVELRFGKPKDEISMPGLHFHFWPLETVEIVKVTEQQQNIGARRRVSGNARPDAVRRPEHRQRAVLGASSRSPIRRPISSTSSDPADTLQQVAESAMREVVGRRPAQDIFRDNRQAIAAGA